MAEKTTYELKGTLRDDCMKDTAVLEGFCPLESDWRELFRWLMSISGDLPYYDRNNKENGRLSSLWENHVLTVLVDILRKDIGGYVDSFVEGYGTSARQSYLDRLKESFGNWISRLEAFIRTNQSVSADNPAVAVSRLLLERLENAMSQGVEFRIRRTCTSEDDTNQSYYRMLGAVEDIQRKGDEYIALIESGGNIDASIALLLTFVRNYCGIVDRFNQRFSGWAEFYRKNILHDIPIEAVQDSTYVVINPDRTKRLETFLLPKGISFLAGKKTDGSDLYYTTLEKTDIVPAHIHAVYALANKGDQLHSTPLSGEKQENIFPLFDTAVPASATLEYGWLLVSRSLVLSEGRRTVSVCIRLDTEESVPTPDLSAFNSDTSSFILCISGSEGWQWQTYETNHDDDNLVFRFTINEGEEVPAACTKELHGITTEYPALRILFSRRNLLDTLPLGLRIKEIGITAEVESIRNFTLIGESGQTDPSQPFYPFGPMGERDSQLIFGHEEVSLKDITAVSLKGVWTKLQEKGFGSIYGNYNLGKTVDENSFSVRCEWQEESRWHECTGSPISLFHQDGSGKLSDDALFELDIKEETAAESAMPYRKNRNGFYRLTLVGPETGFGMNAYYRQFTEVMMHNGKAKEKNWKPVPEQPQVPMLNDLTFGYKSEERIYPGDGGKLFRFTDIFGYEECPHTQGMSPDFLPAMKSPSLVVGVGNIGDTDRIRLYFNLRYAVQGWQPVAVQSPSNVVISRYAGNGIWQEMAEEDVLCEETGGLTRSDFIEVKIPAVEKRNALWLNFSFAGNVIPENMVLDGIYLNCFRVTAADGDGESLPAGTITVPAMEDSRILSVCQPFAGSGGKPAETALEVDIRQRIRIVTRNRAVCGNNYEEMILERFPEIEKVCCVPASENGGSLRIVVFPKPEKRIYLFLPGWKLSEIENYVKRHASPFAKIHAVNPVYEPLSVTFKAVLKEGTRDPGTVKRRITRRIRVFLMPWYMDGVLPDFGVRFSCNALLSRIVNDECLEEFISLDLEISDKCYRITGECRDEDIVLSASDECGVLYVESLGVELVDCRSGVEEARIGTDFIIR